MLLITVSFAFAADAFILLGSENRVSVDGFLPRAKAIVDVPVTDQLSVTATFVAITNYGEAYIGPTWSPTADLSLGIACGVEVADAPWRVAAFISARHTRLSLLGAVEYGGSGLWYKGLAAYNLGPVGVGVLAQRFDGIGPRLSGNHRNFELWAAPLYDYEANAPKALIGLNWTP